MEVGTKGLSIWVGGMGGEKNEQHDRAASLESEPSPQGDSLWSGQAIVFPFLFGHGNITFFLSFTWQILKILTYFRLKKS